jgi:hypothetical protein
MDRLRQGRHHVAGYRPTHPTPAARVDSCRSCTHRSVPTTLTRSSVVARPAGRDGKPDTGIDLVAKSHDTGELTAIQCKFYAAHQTVLAIPATTTRR